MKAFVSGSAGFVGRHMADELERRGFEVWGSDLAKGHDALDVFRKEIDHHRYDLVVHCAFHVGGRAAIDSDRMALARNLNLDSAMFDWAVRTRQPRILYFSSSAVYPVDRQDGWERLGPDMRTRIPNRLRESDIDLSDPQKPDADYGWAKLTGEKLAANARAMGVNVHVVRPFSGYGEDQSLDYPFPSILKRARDGDLTVWGPPGQTRDWIHIDDVIAGALAVVDQDVQEPVNLCTGVPTEMGELARLVNDEVRSSVYHPAHMSLPPAPEVTYLTDKPTGVLYRVGDPTLFHSIYQPKITVEEGISRALAA